jgi:hypothetical protein
VARFFFVELPGVYRYATCGLALWCGGRSEIHSDQGLTRTGVMLVVGIGVEEVMVQCFLLAIFQKHQ